MKNILLSFGILSCIFVQAQIIIHTTDMPDPSGNQLRISTSTNIVNQVTLNADTGTNKTWNFKNLVPNFQELVSFAPVASFNTTFPNYYAAFISGSTYGSQQPNVTLGAISATNVYNFYSNTPAKFQLTGRGFSANANSIPQKYDIGADVVYKFPLTYPNVDTSKYRASTLTQGPVTLISGGQRINTVDGWGVLSTPFGTFNSIRVKSVYHGFDSIQAGIWNVIPREYIEYTWLAVGKKIPLLSIKYTTVGANTTTTIYYQDSLRQLLFNSFTDFTVNKNAVLANSTDTLILTDMSTHNPNSIKWHITPNTFTYVGGTDSTTKVTKIFFSVPGNYNVNLKASYNAATGDTTRINYISVQQKPVVKFGSAITSTNVGTNVSFYDSSICFPLATNWSWSFTPDKVTYKTGTATSRNIVITFDSATTYSVSLKVTNAAGSDSLTKNNYIAVNHVGIKETMPDYAPVIIYPNPAEGHFELVANRNTIDHIEVFDIAGKTHQLGYKWKDQNNCTVDCTPLNTGMYFVKIYFNDKQVSVNKISVR